MNEVTSCQDPLQSTLSASPIQIYFSSLSYHTITPVLNSQPSPSFYPSINQSVIRSFLQASEQMGSSLQRPRCVRLCVCVVYHLIRCRKPKRLRNEKSEKGQGKQRWAEVEQEPEYICVKKERYLPEICEEDLSDGTEGHRHVLLCDGNLRWERSRSKRTSLSVHRTTTMS